MTWARAWRRWVSDDDPPSALDAARRRRAAEVLRRHPRLVDGMLALAVAAFCTPQLVYWSRLSTSGFAARLVLSALLVAPLVWRRRFPLSTFAVAAAVALVQWSLGVTLAGDIALLIYLYTVASRYRLRVGVLAAAVVELGVVLAALRWDLAASLDLPWLPAVVLLSSPVAAALLLGTSVRARRESMTALADRARQLERERDQRAALAVAAERRRIARELHDVVAHSISVMVTLSDAASLKAPREPQRAAEAMRQVSATGHQALDEMRRLLGVLRSEDDPEGRHPQPGIGSIDALADQVRAAGLAVEVDVTGPLAALPAGEGLAVFRIVQESLTNTLKHARGASHAHVGIEVRADVIEVDVRDDGAGQHQAGAPGLGLVGMRERAAVYGGTVEAGPDQAGGWRVQARLPWDGHGHLAVARAREVAR